MADNLTEMIHILESVAKVNRAVTRPFIEKKTGLTIVDEGEDHGQIVTVADQKVSSYLLNGGLKGVEGLREQYPGSFSEEDDTPERRNATTVFQIDPIDGTGDFVDTYRGQVMGPTTLISKLSRESTADSFRPVGGLIFDTFHEIALLSAGETVKLFKVDEKCSVKEVPFERVQPEEWKRGDPVRINRRVSYPQLTFDGPFMAYLEKKGIPVERVPIGGAGIAAMQVFRNYIHPTDGRGKDFADLAPLTILLNAQPDWKTWDTDPTEVIADALGLPARTNIYGANLQANASSEGLKDMHHTNGYVLSTSDPLADRLTELTIEFTERNPDCPLTVKDYAYKKGIQKLSS